MTLGPMEPSMTGNSKDLPVALSVNVTVPAGAMTLVLLPSMDAPLSFRPGGSLRPGRLPDLARRIGRRGRMIKRRSVFAMQYRGCENSARAVGRVGDARQAFVAAQDLHDIEDSRRLDADGQCR